MRLIRETQQKQEHDIFHLRHEAGVQILRDWLVGGQEDINHKWPGLTGEDLVRLQGEARLIERLLKVIDKGPAIKIIQELRSE